MELLAATGRQEEPADAATFDGAATVTRFVSATPAAAKVYRVRFEPGTRLSWHTHDGPQILIVEAGQCEIQVWGQELALARPGDVVRIEAGEKHWHGAAASGAMTHVAVNLGSHTEWHERVAR